MELLTLAVLASVWCLLHSLLALEAFKKKVFRSVAPAPYRLFYTLFSFLSLAPVGLFYLSLPARPLVTYPFPWSLAIATVFVFFLLAALLSFRRFDTAGFLGLREEKAGLITTGTFRYSRHPMYTASIGLLWARSLLDKDLVLNALFSIYLIVGAFIEERRLLRQYGDEYRDYQSRTPMFFPLSFRRKAERPA